MIAIPMTEYSVDVEHTDDGECIYTLYDRYDDEIYSSNKYGTPWTSNVESMIQIGETLLEQYCNLRDENIDDLYTFNY